MKNFGFLQIVHFMVGVVASQFNIMGYYPFVPAVGAMYSLEKEKSVAFYIGLVVGMIFTMPMEITVKYLFVVAIITIGVKFYLWANRNCSGIMAGIIAGIVTLFMNLVGGSLIQLNKTELILTFSESVIVVGLTTVFHFVVEMLRKYPYPQVKQATLSLEPKEAAFVSAVTGLSKVFVSMSQETNVEASKRDMPETVDVLEREITGRLCASCDACCACWNDNRLTLSDSIRELINAVMAKKSKANILKEQYVKQCSKYTGMVEEAMQAFGRLELNEAWAMRLKENRYIIAQQLDAMAELMKDWGQEETCINDSCRMRLARIAYEAGEKATCAENIRIYEREKKRICIKADVSGRWGGGIPTKHYIAAVEKAVGIPMRMSTNSKSIITLEPSEITLYEDTSFYILSGIATRRKNNTSVSGDNFTMFMLDNGMYNVCLSDGMGSGAQASRESEMVVDLMEKFLSAGFKKEAAIKLMNSTMVLKGENNSYSTFDYAGIDLYSGLLEMVKIGGAATFIKRGNEVMCIKPSSLPAGADICGEPEVIKKALFKGDFLVMVTDGVLEYLHVNEPEERFAELIRAIDTENAGVLAKGLLEQVLHLTGGYAMDDMTILAFGIWEK